MSSSYTSIQAGGSDTAQPLNVHKRLKLIERHLRPDRSRFLDCGCGAGDYVFQLVEQLGLDAYGIEFDADKVEHARRHPQHGHRISAGDLQALALDSDEWDYAMLNEVLEHVPDDGAALREVHRILKPGGMLFLYSPNRWYPFETHGVYLQRSGKYVPYWVPFVPYIPLSVGNRFLRYWARNYWHTQLARLVTSAGFFVVETGYLWQTFEGLSGRQPRVIALTKNLLRTVSNVLESTYFLNRFGVSQFLVCQK
jgi:ubiquinone/menaquinone biosynthesis C-methylase UbiE